MLKKVFVEPWFIEFLSDNTYDMFIATIGYENRSRYIAKDLNPKSIQKVAVAFNENRVLEFKKNFAWYQKIDFNILQYSEDDFYQWAKDNFNNFKSPGNTIKILIDISSMSRYRIATLIWALVSSSLNCHFCVDFVYALALYTPPPNKTGPITNMGPISPDFAGWFTEPSSPCSAIIGLGYDLGKAVGTIEYIEPGEIWALNPIGEDQKYEKAVLKANKLYLDTLEKKKIIDYDVNRPFETYHYLDSLIFGIMKSSRPILIPFGPKIFTLCSLLAAIIRYPNVSVWRVSSGKYEHISNRFPSGTIVGLRVNFLPNT
jgi:hypothetical protein